MSKNKEVIISQSKGHKIYYDTSCDAFWRFCDTDEEFAYERKCVKCDKYPINGHDACIANLPGVKNACCGHGVEEGYVQFENGVVIRGKFELP